MTPIRRLVQGPPRCALGVLLPLRLHLPDKYRCISQYKETFKGTYEHLYHHCPEIFSSLTYQMNDQIYGHVSIIKAYPSTWMVHHLAALPMGGNGQDSLSCSRYSITSTGSTGCRPSG